MAPPKSPALFPEKVEPVTSSEASWLEIAPPLLEAVLPENVELITVAPPGVGIEEAAADHGAVAGEGGSCHCEPAAVVIDSAAAVGRDVARESAVDHVQRAAIVVDSACEAVGGVSPIRHRQVLEGEPRPSDTENTRT